MTQPIDIISGALRSIGAIASGDTLDATIANDSLSLLNDMLDQWSNSKQMLFCVQEVIHELTGGQYIYQIGPGGNVGASFTGSLSGTVLTVTALSAGALSVGQIIAGGGILDGTAITSLGTATGGNGLGAIGTYYVNLTQVVGSLAITSSAPRPLRINSAFVRVVNSITGVLDYPVAVLSCEDYELIGIKTLPGPWPRGLYYQPSEPVGILNYWPNPSSGEMHLFCDTVLNRFATLNDTVILPQGYAMALRWCLAELLMPEYPATAAAAEIRGLIPGYAAQGRALIKRTNARPQQAARFDPILTMGRRNDAGWILSGGFNG